MTSRADLKFMQKGRDLKKKPSSKNKQIHIEKKAVPEEDVFDDVVIPVKNENSTSVSVPDIHEEPDIIELPATFPRNSIEAEEEPSHLESVNVNANDHEEENENIITLDQLCCSSRSLKLICVILYRLVIFTLLMIILLMIISKQ